MVAINFPDSPTNGQEHLGYVWDATNNVWNRLPTLPALDLVNFSAVAPSNPQDGQFWFDTTAGKMYVYYNDGSSAQWVSTLGGLVGQTGTEGQILVHNGTEWLPSDGISHNAIINGDFGIWQRGTSFSGTNTLLYTSDRWQAYSAGSFSVTQESFSPAEIEAIGYGDAQHFARFDVTVGAAFSKIIQKIEDVRKFAGQTVTFSFWAKGNNPSSTGAFKIYAIQNFGSGGSSSNNENQDFTVSSSWQRFSITFNLDSVSGKTIGSSSFLALEFSVGDTSDIATLDIWGVQLEAGSVATPFRLAGGGSKAAELALCQRYYTVISEGLSKNLGSGHYYLSSYLIIQAHFPTTMRTAPSLVATSGTNYFTIDRAGAADSFNSLTISRPTQNSAAFINNTEISGTAGTSGVVYLNNASASVALDAEL